MKYGQNRKPKMYCVRYYIKGRRGEVRQKDVCDLVSRFVQWRSASFQHQYQHSCMLRTT